MTPERKKWVIPAILTGVLAVMVWYYYQNKNDSTVENSSDASLIEPAEATSTESPTPTPVNTLIPGSFSFEANGKTWICGRLTTPYLSANDRNRTIHDNALDVLISLGDGEVPREPYLIQDNDDGSLLVVQYLGDPAFNAMHVEDAVCITEDSQDNPYFTSISDGFSYIFTLASTAKFTSTDFVTRSDIQVSEDSLTV